MPRKLKTFVTESGFFELAVAAPSMKEALRDWGIAVNLFQQGLARQTDDPAIVAAAEGVPGQVLRRPIGSKTPFRQSAELPKVKGAPARSRPKPKSPATEKAKAKKSREKSPKKLPKKSSVSQHHAVDLDAIRKARAALHAAEARHRSKNAALDDKRVALDRDAERLEREWQRQKQKLEKEIERLKV
jgi:cell division septation protein DedD